MTRGAFRTQLFVTVTLILVVVIAASTVVTLLVTQKQAYQAGQDLARLQVEQYTRRSAFAAIVGPDNPPVVVELMNEIARQQAVVAVELRYRDGRSLGRAGSQEEALKDCGFAHRSEIVSHFAVTRHGAYWCAIGPILQRADVSSLGVRWPGSVIGELRIADSTEGMQSMVEHLAAWNVGAGALVLAIGIILAWRGVKRLTDPLNHLAEVMRELREGRMKVRAALHGPAEVVAIATVFNDLLARVEQEASTLEHQVEERTKELRSAWEAARAAERYKSVFMSAVTHEMRTPLHVINAHATDVLGELEFIESADTARTHMEVILKEAAELLRRLNQILELARAEATSGVVEVQEFDLAEFAADVQERSLPLAKEQGNALELAWDSRTITADRDKLWVVVSNLVTNACKFTRNGVVQVTIRVSERSELELWVRDNGRGISKDAQQRLWQQFARPPRAEGRVAGFGLGLAIVKRLTDVLRGRVELTSEPGVGTSVRVVVPVGIKVTAMEPADVVASGTEGRRG